MTTPDDRQAGISCGHAFFATCNRAWVLKGEITEGMKQDIAHFKSRGIEVEIVEL